MKEWVPDRIDGVPTVHLLINENKGEQTWFTFAIDEEVAEELAAIIKKHEPRHQTE